MSMIRNSLLELQLRPAELPSRFDVPCPLLGGQLRFQDDHILSPADGHGLRHDLRRVAIRSAEIPHTAEVPGGEASGVGIRHREIFSGGDSRAFFRPGADELADLAIQFHLCQEHFHQ